MTDGVGTWRLELDVLRADLKYGLRRMAANPWGTIVVIGTLAICIGASTAIFSLIDALVLRKLPVPHPDRLAYLATVTREGASASISFDAYQLVRQADPDWGDVAADAGTLATLVADERPYLARGSFVSGNYFSMIGVPLALGRPFTPGEDVVGREGVVVVSYALWQQLGGDATVIGKAVSIERVPFVIVGVTDRAFTGTSVGTAVDIWMPLNTQAQVLPPERRLDKTGSQSLELWARLRDGVTLAEASGRLNALWQRRGDPDSPLAAESQKTPAHVQLVSGGRGRSLLRTELSSVLTLSLALVGFVLLLACANIANVRLASVSAQQSALAVRLSLGGSRFRIVRESLTESALLAIAGGLAGLAVARALTQVLVGFMPRFGPFPPTIDVRLDLGVLAFTAAVSLATGLLVGALPAWRASRTDPAGVLRGDGGVASGRSSKRRGARVATGLVWTQVAISTLVVSVAVLFAGSLYALKSRSLGFEPSGVLLFQVDPRQQGYKAETQGAFYTQLLRELRNMPGVLDVSMARRGFLVPDFTKQDIAVPGYEPRKNSDRFVNYDIIAPHFFSTMGVRMLAGRDFAETDAAGALKVVIVNQTMARHFFGTDQVVGRRFTYGKRGESTEPVEIVGVAPDATYQSLRELEAPRLVYAPYLQAPALPGMQIQVKSALSTDTMTRSVRAAMARVDKYVPILGTASMSDVVNRSLVAERLGATCGTLLGAVALVLACMGTYGVTAYAMSRRTREIGVRLALGGRPRDIVTLAARDTLWVIATGAAVGALVAVWLSRVAAGLLAQMATASTWVFAVALAMVVLSALIAAWIPIGRAARLSPLVALREG